MCAGGVKILYQLSWGWGDNRSKENHRGVDRFKSSCKICKGKCPAQEEMQVHLIRIDT